MRCSASCPHWHAGIRGDEWVLYCGLMDGAEIAREPLEGSLSLTKQRTHECIAPADTLPMLRARVNLHIWATEVFLEEIETEIAANAQADEAAKEAV